MTKSIVYTVTVKGNRQEWTFKGKLHRLDGPAIIEGNHQSWWANGELHREDDPAVINDDYQLWYENGKLHRLDGPAYINGNKQAWYIEGKQYTQEQFDEKTKKAPCVNKEVIIDGVTYKLVPKETS